MATTPGNEKMSSAVGNVPVKEVRQRSEFKTQKHAKLDSVINPVSVVAGPVSQPPDFILPGPSNVQRSRAKNKPKHGSGVDIVLLEHPTIPAGSASSASPAVTDRRGLPMSGVANGREAMWGRALTGDNSTVSAARVTSKYPNSVKTSGKHSSLINVRSIAPATVEQPRTTPLDDLGLHGADTKSPAISKQVGGASSVSTSITQKGARTGSDTTDARQNLKVKMDETIKQAKKIGTTVLQSKVVVSIFVFFLTMLLLICLNPPMAQTTHEMLVENEQTGLESIEVVNRRSWKKIIIWSCLTFVLALLLPYTCAKKTETVQCDN